MKRGIFICLAGCLMLTLAAFQQKPWAVPAKNAAITNPEKADASSLKEGKDLYVTHCQSCHGKKGKGDGPKAAQLETQSGNFTTAAFQQESDGSLFYKVSTGRKDMPSFKKKIPKAEDIWSIINYLRTLK